MEGEYLPVVLNGNQWQLLAGKANDGTVYGEVVGTRDPLQGDIFTPVSYTHLDVYKRQV